MTKQKQLQTSPKTKRTDRDELKLLREIARLTSAELDLATVLKSVVDLVAEVTEADSVFIYLFNDKHDRLVLKASKIPRRKRALEAVSLQVGEGITGWVAQENRPVSIGKRAYEDPRFKTFDVLPEDRYESFLSAPIVYKNKPIGVINVQHEAPHRHSESVVQLMATIADQVGGVIENALLYEENKRKAHQLDSLLRVSASIISDQYLDQILNLIVVVTAEILDSKICSIMLLDTSGTNLVIKATQSLSEAYRNKPPVSVRHSLSGEVIRSKKARAVFDVTREETYMYRDLALQEGLSSMLCVPMIIKDKSIGVVNVYTQAPHDFTKEEINTIQVIANQAAVAIENTKLMDEALKVREALETKKIVERAQAVLMKSNQISADAAYKLIHKKSMDSSRPMKEIAEAILLAAEFQV